MTSHRILTRWTGFCASCPDESTLLLVSTGPHGFRAWLSGAGPEDRELSYTCAVCGRVEHVPATEDDDVVYDATLPRWPDWIEQVVEPVMVEAAPFVATDDFATAAVRMLTQPAPEPVAAVPVPRPGTVRVVTLPSQRVAATDLVLSAA